MKAWCRPSSPTRPYPLYIAITAIGMLAVFGASLSPDHRRHGDRDADHHGADVHFGRVRLLVPAELYSSALLDSPSRCASRPRGDDPSRRRRIELINDLADNLK